MSPECRGLTVGTPKIRVLQVLRPLWNDQSAFRSGVSRRPNIREIQMSWTDDRVDTLRKLWTEGLSASQIAAELGGVTRNAVIGKVHRLGLSGRAKGSNQGGGARRKKPATRANGYAKQKTNSTADAKKTSSASAPVRPAPIVDLPEPPALMLNLLQLTEHTCKYPIGDPQEETFGFCGAKSREGDPYCEYHCRLTYQPAADRRRDRSQKSSPRRIAN